MLLVVCGRVGESRLRDLERSCASSRRRARVSVALTALLPLSQVRMRHLFPVFPFFSVLCLSLRRPRDLIHLRHFPSTGALSSTRTFLPEGMWRLEKTMFKLHALLQDFGEQSLEATTAKLFKTMCTHLRKMMLSSSSASRGKHVQRTAQTITPAASALQMQLVDGVPMVAMEVVVFACPCLRTVASHQKTMPV